MTIQSAVGVTLTYAAESTFGTAASAGGTSQVLRRVSSSLVPSKETFQSNEVRQDYQVSDLRHGMRSARGSIEGELSIQSYDDFLQALLGGTWASGVSCSPSDFATGVTIATSGTTSTLTFAGAGSLLTKGFKIGDIVRGTGLTNPANNAKNLRIVALTATVMTVTPAITATTQQASGWSVAVAGKKLTVGATKRSFSIEQSYLDVDISELFTGCRINSGSIRVPPNGMTTVSFDILGQNGVVLPAAQAPYFTAATAAPNTSIVAGLDGGLRFAGAERAVVTSLDLNFTNGMSVTPVIGATVSPDVFQGRKVVTGNVSAFLEDESLINVFLNETEADLVVMLPTSTGSPQDFLTLNMQRVKLSGISHSIGADGGVIIQFPFQALLANGGAATAYDSSSLVIQRSNT